MKFSLNMAQKFSNVNLKDIPREEILKRIGAQLGAVEDTHDWQAKYAGIIVAKVVSCIKHPDADKLSLCMLDDAGVVENVDRDENGLVQVVCGAPNVREGLLVGWLPPGVAVPNSVDKEPFILEARELRGKISNGMIASASELDISDDHDGILEISEQDNENGVRIGQPITELYGLDDFVIDCENKMFTHRPDCFGNLGIARELAGINGLSFESPDWYKTSILVDKITENENQDIKLTVDNPIPNLVSRFSVIAVSDIDNKKSPIWLQSYLKRVGIKSINSVVDVTNYVMHLTGQPLHAFDYDKLLKLSDNPTIFPRMASEGEKINLLGGKTIELTQSDIVIATDKQAVALAGVMGGADTEVDDNTKNIVIECANFDMYTIRRTSMRHGLFTEAVTRFNKGQSPLQNDKVLAFAVDLMTNLTGARQSSVFYDLVSFDKSADNLNKVSVNINFINSRLGSSLGIDETKNMLSSVEFDVQVDSDNLLITAPFWRMDIMIPEDIVEEVGRLYGYDKLPVIMPVRSSRPPKIDRSINFKRKITNTLSRLGANQVLTYSFVHGDLMRSTGTDPQNWAYHLRNALSPDLQYYRTSLIPSLLNKIHPNLKAQAGLNENKFALFEIGKAHVKGEMEESEPNLPKQMNRLAFVYAADAKSIKNAKSSAYYATKLYLDEITGGKAQYIPLENNDYPITATYQKGRSAIVMLNDQYVGVIGEFNSKAKKSLKLPDFCAGFEVDLDILMNYLTPRKYEPISTFPSVMQDVTLEVSEQTTWFQLKNLVNAELSVESATNGYDFKLVPQDIFKPGNSDKKNISFGIELSHPNKTLKKEELTKIIDTIQKAVHEKLD